MQRPAKREKRYYTRAELKLKKNGIGMRGCDDLEVIKFGVSAPSFSSSISFSYKSRIDITSLANVMF